MMLAARADVHPTVVDLLVDAARQLHSGPGVFEKRGEFPHLHAVDEVPVSGQALLYTREGSEPAAALLAAGVADAIQRTIVLAVPLLAVPIPLARFLPALLDLIGRRRMFLGYAGLRRIERAMRAREPGRPRRLLRELDRIEELVSGEKESVIKAGELYTFRAHVGVVRDRCSRASGRRGPAVRGRGREDEGRR